ncbi:MAG: hypothetical protein ACRDSZ_00720 [Pseudonocardiaceae bacterium]
MIPHLSLPEGSSIYGGTKVFPDYQAENGEMYFGTGRDLCTTDPATSCP